MSFAYNKKLRWLLFLVLLIAFVVALRLKPTRAILSVSETVEANPALQSLPAIMLWAWERPEHLDFIDSKKIGVAFLAKTIYLRGVDVATRPRLQLLVLPKGTQVVAVVRIESDRLNIPALSEGQLERIVSEIAQTSQSPGVLAIQIDFDAKVSERDFYRRLLLKLRQHLPPTMPLSITALASWCAGDNWLSGLPIDEAVPMLFRMGLDGRQFRSRLNSGEDPFADPCNTAVGVSTDELITTPNRKRLYIFSPKPWTQQSLKSTLENFVQ